MIGLDVQILPERNSIWMCSALEPKIQYRFYFHLVYLWREGQRYLGPALNAKLDRVPCLVNIDDKDGYNKRPPGAAVLRAGWYHRQGRLVGGRILAGDTFYKFYQEGQDGQDWCSSGLVYSDERAQPCCLASECYRQSRTGGGRSRYRNLKHRMVEYLGEFWSEDLAGLFEPLRSFLHMYSCLRQSCHIKLWYYPAQEPEQYFEIRTRNNTTASMTMHTSFFGAVLQVHPRETSVGSLEELKVHF